MSTRHSEAGEHRAVGYGVPVPVGTTKHAGQVYEGTTSDHSILPDARPGRISTHRVFPPLETGQVALGVAIPAPFGYEAVHVIEAPGVGLLLAHGVGLLPRIPVVPRIAIDPFGCV